MASIITGVLSLVGVIVASTKSAEHLQNDIQHKLEISQAVTDTKIEELTREVREHNNYARRVPVLESQVESLTKMMEDK